MKEHFLAHIQNSINNYWTYPAFSDFKGKTYTYGDMAIEVKRLHLLFEEVGIKKGDRIALCSRNMARWGIAFVAISSYEAVAVPILNDFTPDSIHFLVNHSEAKIFFVGDDVWAGLDASQMPGLQLIIGMNNYNLRHSNNEEFTTLFNNLDEDVKARYPQGIQAGDISFPTDNDDDLCIINYTSGTTSASKGVMLSYRSINSNTQFAIKRMWNEPGLSLVSMLPMAHMYGLAFEIIFQLASACHIHFLAKVPSPQILMASLAQNHPYLVITVPLVMEKVFKKSIFPTMKKPLIKVLVALPGIRNIIYSNIRKRLLTAFGGNVHEIIFGGAAMNQEVETLMKKFKMPYSVGYGMTETGPLLGYENYWNFVQNSCGKVVDRMQIKVDSEDPQNIPGEFLIKGDNVMMGYYKNPEATKAAFTEDGWMRTGDLGIIDKEGNIFIKGRSKNLILGANGQNIFPEEIEDKLNNLPYVSESVVVDRDKKIVALVYPDYDLAKQEQLDENGLIEMMENNRIAINALLPSYSRISKIELRKDAFEKTPKHSIRRFLYK